jgi:phosphodiesterase/alkaline phosphatase D-like protein
MLKTMLHTNHQSSLFRHGVASGDPLTDRVIIWTRVERPMQVQWTVATDEALQHVVTSGKASAEEANDLTVKVDVLGLEPSTEYFYFFDAQGETSRWSDANVARGDRSSTLCIVLVREVLSGLLQRLRTYGRARRHRVCALLG